MARKNYYPYRSKKPKVSVKGYSYKRNGKTVYVKGHRRAAP